MSDITEICVGCGAPATGVTPTGHGSCDDCREKANRAGMGLIGDGSHLELVDEEWLARGGDYQDDDDDRGDGDGDGDEVDLSDLRHDDIDNATRLQRLHGERIRYVHKWGQWLVWDGSRWQRDVKGALILELAKDVPRTLYEQAAKQLDSDLGKAAARLSSTSKLQAMVTLTRGIDGIHIEHETLDSDPWALCVANGWVDLKTGGFHDPDPDKLMTMSTRAEFDLEATAPMWEKSLAEWMPEAEDRDYFQRLCGASLAGRVRDHHLVIVYGTGGNGKGTALGAIANVLGDYYTVPHKSLLVTQRHDTHDTVKASLFRVRMAVAAESDKRVKLNEASIKELTGGDLLRARRLYEDEWSFRPSHTMWLQTNYLPEVSGGDRGIWRRIKVFPWRSTFSGAREDRELPAKLEAEASGILNWLLEGVARWRKVGLGADTEPRSVREATVEYREAEDIVGRWVKEAGLSLGDHLIEEASELTRSWKDWSETEFGRARRFHDVVAWLEAHECRKDTYRRSVGGKRSQTTVWYGVGWTDQRPATSDDEPPYDEPPPEEIAP